MKFTETEIPGVLILEPRVFADDRGFFMETYQKQKFHDAGIHDEFVQDNHSRSVYGTLRGLHFQVQHPQGKLCRVVRGEVLDVVVDLRRESSAFGRSYQAILSEQNRRQIYVPPGLAHGFCVVSEVAEFVYKCTDYYSPTHERTILWNDVDLAIHWPVEQPLLSAKDLQGLTFQQYVNNP